MVFQLHHRLQADCYQLGLINNCHLLLHKNALVPWFILVPETGEQELFKLPEKQQLSVQSTINLLAAFTEKHFNADKLNIATIGNIVPQLHIHIIARKVTDFCWPDPVWGQAESSVYSDSEIHTIKQLLLNNKLITTD